MTVFCFFLEYPSCLTPRMVTRENRSSSERNILVRSKTKQESNADWNPRSAADKPAHTTGLVEPGYSNYPTWFWIRATFPSDRRGTGNKWKRGTDIEIFVATRKRGRGQIVATVKPRYIKVALSARQVSYIDNFFISGQVEVLRSCTILLDNSCVRAFVKFVATDWITWRFNFITKRMWAGPSVCASTCGPSPGCTRWRLLYALSLLY